MAEAALSIVTLGAFLWALLFQLPKARREREWFPVVCSIMTALVALLAWLLIGVGTRSR